METKIFNFQAALKSKEAAQSIKAIEFPQDERSDSFYPEMGEQRNPTKPILGKYIYNSYNIKWRAIRSVEMGKTILKDDRHLWGNLIWMEFALLIPRR